MVFQGDSCSFWGKPLRKLGTAKRGLVARVRDGHPGDGGGGRRRSGVTGALPAEPLQFPADSIGSEPSVLRPAQGCGTAVGTAMATAVPGPCAGFQSAETSFIPERDPSSRARLCLLVPSCQPAATGSASR